MAGRAMQRAGGIVQLAGRHHPAAIAQLTCGSAGAARTAAAANVTACRDALEVALAELGDVDLRGVRYVQVVVTGLQAALPLCDLDVQAAAFCLLPAFGDLSDPLDGRICGHFEPYFR